jgi:hypothetical protein
MANNSSNTSDMIRGHIAAAIARLEPYSRGTSSLDQDAVMAALAVAEHELGQVLGLLERLRGAP